jgi:hypothetical protein
MAVTAGLVVSAPAAGAAPIIEYTAVDLADVVVGEDLWRYDYAVSGYAFAQHEGFDIFFAPDRYADLAATSPNPVDWDVIVIQPDLVLPDDGIYSAIANVTNPSLALTFSVEFVWTGSGMPGTQPFEVNQYDAQHDLIQQQTGTGRTQPLGGVPEPATLLLLGSGIGSLVYRRRRTGN